jgi:hypothetical protein
MIKFTKIHCESIKRKYSHKRKGDYLTKEGQSCDEAGARQDSRMLNLESIPLLDGSYLDFICTFGKAVYSTFFCVYVIIYT